MSIEIHDTVTEPNMIPFLCEITLCCIVSYHFALLVMQSEKRSDNRGTAPETCNTSSGQPMCKPE